MKIFTVVSFVLLIIVAASSPLLAQNRFEGYSFSLEAGNDPACPMRYLPGANGGNTISVFAAGTEQRTAAANLTACDGSRIENGNQVASNDIGKWCFQGSEPFYDIRLKTGVTYFWYPLDKNTGFYNVKDFRPVTRIGGAEARYVFNEPADYTRTIKNAVAFIASRQGGVLRFPDGDYTVGTLDGTRRDPAYTGITLPSGITVEGAGAGSSIPTTNLPTRYSVTRIRLRNENQAIFKIGGCTNQVVIRQLELLGNSAGYQEPPRNSTGNYGVEAVGMWPVNAITGDNSSQFFQFENMTFQNLDRGIYVHNANETNCNERVQLCRQWRFDYVQVNHSLFQNNKSGIWIETYNTDWKITNSVFNYTAQNAPGDGIHIATAGTVLIDQCWGGGYDYERLIGGTFIWIGTIQTLTVINSGSERGQRSIYMHPVGSMTSLMIVVVGGVFDDKIELRGRANYISTGSYYGPTTIQADPTTTITSTGDRFCYDVAVLPGRCKDERGNMVARPGFGNGRVMFQTGRVGEGTGANRIESRPNFFGYNLEIGNGLMQFDTNITFKDISEWTTPAANRPELRDGALVYCKDCRKDQSGLCSQGVSGTDGAFAKRINSRWRCD